MHQNEYCMAQRLHQAALPGWRVNRQCSRTRTLLAEQNRGCVSGARDWTEYRLGERV